MNKIDKENLYLATPRDEEVANRTVAWYEKESAANHGFNIFFLPLIKLGFLLLLYIICAFVFKGLA